jgi:hypothetical protein
MKVLHDFLFRVLLFSGGANTAYLSSVQECEVFEGYPKMLKPSETEMPLRDTILPSKRELILLVSTELIQGIWD